MNEIIERLNKFRVERDWKKFHTPENLAKSIVIEAAELLENFQWLDRGKLDNVKDELADILIYCLLLCEEYNLDFKQIISDKITSNEKKYPVDKAKGNAKKYTEFE